MNAAGPRWIEAVVIATFVFPLSQVSPCEGLFRPQADIFLHAPSKFAIMEEREPTGENEMIPYLFPLSFCPHWLIYGKCAH